MNINCILFIHQVSRFPFITLESDWCRRGMSHRRRWNNSFLMFLWILIDWFNELRSIATLPWHGFTKFRSPYSFRQRDMNGSCEEKRLRQRNIKLLQLAFECLCLIHHGLLERVPFIWSVGTHWRQLISWEHNPRHNDTPGLHNDLFGFEHWQRKGKQM